MTVVFLDDGSVTHSFHQQSVTMYMPLYDLSVSAGRPGDSNSNESGGLDSNEDPMPSEVYDHQSLFMDGFTSAPSPGTGSYPNTADAVSILSAEFVHTELRQFTMLHLPAYFAPGFWSELISTLVRTNTAVGHAIEAHAAVVASRFKSAGMVSATAPIAGVQSFERLASLKYKTAIQALRSMSPEQDHGFAIVMLVCRLLFADMHVLSRQREQALNQLRAGLQFYLSTNPMEQTHLIPVDATNKTYATWRIAVEMRERYLSLSVNQNSVHRDPLLSSLLGHSNSLHCQNQLGMETNLVILQHLIQNLHSLENGSDQSSDVELLHHFVQSRQDVMLQIQFFEINLKPRLDAEGDDREALAMRLRYNALLFSTSELNLGHEPLDVPARIEEDLSGCQKLLEGIPTLQPISAHNAPKRIPNYRLASTIIQPLLNIARFASSLQAREQAILLLRQANSIEGIYESDVAAKVAQNCLQAEMAGESQPTILSYWESFE